MLDSPVLAQNRRAMLQSAALEVYMQFVNSWRAHLIDIFDHVALWLSLRNDTCKETSKLLASSVCTKLLFGIWTPA